MTATSQLIATLVAGGMDVAEAAGLVARAAVEMTGAMTKKSAGAARQQRYRERHKASQSVTGDDDADRNEASQSVTSLRCDQASQSVTNRNESVTSNNASLSKEEKKEVIKEKREGTRGSRLPDDWQPSVEDLEAASTLLGFRRADDELAKFRDHWKAQPGGKGVKSDWPATWRNWYRRANEYGSRNGIAVSNNRTDPAAGRATAREAHHVASVGSAALRYLKEGTSAGSGGDTSGSPGFAGRDDSRKRSENTH